MKKTMFLLLGILLLLPGVLAHAGDDDYAHHTMMNSTSWGYGMWGMGAYGWILMILVIIVLILLIVWLIKKIQEPHHSHRRR